GGHLAGVRISRTAFVAFGEAAFGIVAVAVGSVLPRGGGGSHGRASFVVPRAVMRFLPARTVWWVALARSQAHGVLIYTTPGRLTCPGLVPGPDAALLPQFAPHRLSV